MSITKVAVVVVDDYQGQGLGTLLLRTLAAVAVGNGTARFRAYFLWDNSAIRAS